MKWEILKGSEKDFEGAPEWACYLACAVGYPSDAWVSDADDKYQYTVGDCGEFKGEFINYEWPKGSKVIAERRPITEPVVNQQVTTEWSGEGLPPVGVECEVMEERSRSAFCDWSRCKIVNFNHRNGAESQVCIIDDNGDFAILYENDSYHFRPIRSAEDVAREELKTVLISAFGNLHHGSADGVEVDYIAGKLFEAGYRKVE